MKTGYMKDNKICETGEKYFFPEERKGREKIASLFVGHQAPINDMRQHCNNTEH